MKDKICKGEKMKSKISDKYLIEAINTSLKNYGSDVLQEEDLEKVEELNLNNKTFSGVNKKIDLSQIKELKNLSSLSLQYFEINDKNVDILQGLEKLKNISLISTKYTAKKEIDLEKLNSIEIQFCEIKDGYQNIIMPPIIKIKDGGMVNLNEIQNKENIRKIVINNCEIKQFSKILEFTSLKSINIDGSKIDNSDILSEIKCPISFEKNCYPME